MSKALLLATLFTVGQPGDTVSTSNVLSDSSLCKPAIEQVVRHHKMQNYVYSYGKYHSYARKTLSKQGQLILKVDCKDL